jgi:trimeric autotransporter adhesin
MKKLISCLSFFIISLNVVAQVGLNNACSGAFNIAPVTGTCPTTTYSLQNANATTGLGAGNYDAWFKFTTPANIRNVVISIPSSAGANLSPANFFIEAFPSNTCPTNLTGSLGVAPEGATGLSLTNLNPLTEYLFRVYSTTNPTATPASSWNYTVCVSYITTTNITAGKMNEVYRQTVISPANALADPWEITYGPDNYLWITEAKGYKVNRMNPVTGAKQVVLDVSQGSTFLPLADQPFNAQFNIATNNPQGGFAGLALHPQFTGAAGGQNYVYVSYVHTHLGGVAYRNRIVRFLYNTSTNRLESPVSLCDTIPGSGDHNSQRMIIAPMTQGGSDYYLFYAAGDMGAGQQFPTNANIIRPQKAQRINAYEGKILRFALSDTCSGSGNDRWIPASNPYNNVAPIVGKSAVWCTGIRNNQGFAYNPELNILYGASHGAFSDDEINIIEGFKNYGHPLIVGYADGNYNGTTTPGLSTSISAGVAFGYNDATYTVDGQAAAVGTCPPIGDEVANMNTINTTAVLYGAYKDPLFSAYPGPTSGVGAVSTIWSAATTPNGAGWHSEAWSGLGYYGNTYIPGWKNTLLAAGLKWGRTIRLKLNATGTTVIPTAGFDTATYFQSGNRYRDIAFSPNGRDIYLSMDRSAAGSAGTIGNPTPTVPNCLGCVVRYEFLGYGADATALAGSTISKSIDVTDGTVNTCNTGTTVTIDAANGNNNLWVPITGPDGNIMAEINANGNNLGIVTSSFYKNSGAIRNKGGVRYLDRNITITPQFQPTLPVGTPLVKIRLYISKAEFDALDADVASGLTGTGNIGLLKILKNNDPCLATASAATTTITPTNTILTDLQHGANGYVLQANISSFSSFYFGTANFVLPLDLLTFTGSLQNNATTLLKWQTENEVNTSYFEIERSSDGNSFNKIGTVSAAGNNTSVLDYSFTDNDVANQPSLVVYYRLKMVDINGAFKYSNVITITLADITGRVTVVPNPVSHEARITVAAPEDGKLNYKIVDNAGRTIIQKTVSVRKGAINTIFVDMSRLSTGMYYLNVTGAGINSNTKLQKL